jgi:hypothetical protein
MSKQWETMIWRLPLIVLAFVATDTGASAGICRYQNLMPDFFAFEARTNALAPDDRGALFASDFAPRYPDFYGDSEFGGADALRKAAQSYFDPAKRPQIPGFAPLTDEHMRAVADAAIPAFEKAQSDFRKIFPDFRCEAAIGFGPSLLHFDGNTYKDSRGRAHLLFGIDLISMLHAPQDMPAFLAHELFHIYHAQILRGVIPKDDSVVWWAMWEEGLATYMSQRMNMPLSEQQVLWFPTDLTDRMLQPGATARAASLMLADLDKSDGYATWFQAGNSAPNLPARAGYFMGLRMVEEIGRDHSLQWLAHLKPDDVRPLAKAFLQAQANGQ